MAGGASGGGHCAWVGAGRVRPGGPPVKPLRISPIDAGFNPAKFETDYSVDVLNASSNPELRKAVREGKVTATWTLELTLVDVAGAHPPGRPDEAAAIDLGCTNAGVGLSNQPFKQAIDRRDEDSDFYWYHPTGAPSDKYHCDHTMMGPKGHQGLITVVVSDGVWVCTATYKGTNDSNRHSVKAGTASEPTCKRTHA